MNKNLRHNSILKVFDLHDQNNILNTMKESFCKKLICMLVFCFIFFNYGFSIRTPEKILANTEVSISKYVINHKDESIYVLEMNYAESTILSPLDEIVMKNLQITEITLVYTDYPKNVDLYDLNLARIKQIKKINKELISNEKIKWQIVKQTDCFDEKSAKELFHGVILKTVNSELNCYFLSHLPLELKNMFNGLKSKKDAKKVLKNLKDTTVLSVLNKLSGENMTVIFDFTSSMYEYSGQLLLWFILNTQQHKFSNVVCFNDGNMMLDSRKLPGKVGGIYDSENVDPISMLMLAAKTASNGVGGQDLEENDLEAVKYAINKFQKSEGLY
jgi:hypothetical protein